MKKVSFPFKPVSMSIANIVQLKIQRSKHKNKLCVSKIGRNLYLKMTNLYLKMTNLDLKISSIR